MSPTLPAEIQALLGSRQALMFDPLVWWEIGVIVLAAVAALLVHRLLSQGLVERTEQNAEFAVRHLALKTLQRVYFRSACCLALWRDGHCWRIKTCRWDY